MTEIIPLVYFSHAELKIKENLNAKIELIHSRENDSHKNNLESYSSNKKFKLSINDQEMNYEAFEEDDQPFMIGVLDKENNEISLCNTPYFVMKPECCIISRIESNQNIGANQSSTYSEKLDMLTAAFGSSKKRKAMQTKLKNKIDIETLETAVTAAVEESKKSLEKQKNLAETDIGNISLEQFSILPTPNKDAKTPQDVYNFFDVLGLSQAEFERYTTEQATKFATTTTETLKKWKDTNIYSDYVCQHAIIISGSKISHQYKLQKAKQLVYMNYLISLYKLKSAQLRNKNPLEPSEVPDAIVKRLFDLYTVVSASNAQSKSVRTIPRRLKDKLICHILILALHIDDFSTSIDSFQKDLKLSMQKIIDFYQALGCYIKNQVIMNNNKKTVIKKAELKLPLNEMNKFEAKKNSRKK